MPRYYLPGDVPDSDEAPKNPFKPQSQLRRTPVSVHKSRARKPFSQGENSPVESIVSGYEVCKTTVNSGSPEFTIDNEAMSSEHDELKEEGAVSLRNDNVLMESPSSACDDSNPKNTDIQESSGCAAERNEVQRDRKEGMDESTAVQREEDAHVSPLSATQSTDRVAVEVHDDLTHSESAGVLIDPETNHPSQKPTSPRCEELILHTRVSPTTMNPERFRKHVVALSSLSLIHDKLSPANDLDTQQQGTECSPQDESASLRVSGRNSPCSKRNGSFASPKAQPPYSQDGYDDKANMTLESPKANEIDDGLTLSIEGPSDRHESNCEVTKPQEEIESLVRSDVHHTECVATAVEEPIQSLSTELIHQEEATGPALLPPTQIFSNTTDYERSRGPVNYQRRIYELEEHIAFVERMLIDQRRARKNLEQKISTISIDFGSFKREREALLKLNQQASLTDQKTKQRLGEVLRSSSRTTQHLRRCLFQAELDYLLERCKRTEAEAQYHQVVVNEMLLEAQLLRHENELKMFKDSSKQQKHLQHVFRIQAGHFLRKMTKLCDDLEDVYDTTSKLGRQSLKVNREHVRAIEDQILALKERLKGAEEAKANDNAVQETLLKMKSDVTTLRVSAKETDDVLRELRNRLKEARQELNTKTEELERLREVVSSRQQKLQVQTFYIFAKCLERNERSGKGSALSGSMEGRVVLSELDDQDESIANDEQSTCEADKFFKKGRDTNDARQHEVDRRSPQEENDGEIEQENESAKSLTFENSSNDESWEKSRPKSYRFKELKRKRMKTMTVKTDMETFASHGSETKTNGDEGNYEFHNDDETLTDKGLTFNLENKPSRPHRKLLDMGKSTEAKLPAKTVRNAIERSPLLTLNGRVSPGAGKDHRKIVNRKHPSLASSFIDKQKFKIPKLRRD